MSRWSGIPVVELACVGLLAFLPASAGAQEADVANLIERGKRSYLLHCGACHGVEGAGDGAIAAYLKVELSDLRHISAVAGGEYPFDDVYDIIDGRDVPGHGTRAMPVWGPAFKGLDPEADKKVIKEKVVELVYYIKSIQIPKAVSHPMMGGESE